MKIILHLLLLTLSLKSQTAFRFAHISDTHIGSATAAEDLRRTVHDINSLGNISFAILTGDITEFGADHQLRLAKQILDSLTVPWYIVPGNHDMKWSESGGISFSKIFGSERFVFDHEEYTFLGLHQGPRMRMGDAYWATEDVAWLDSVLSAMKNPKRRFFIATHYPADSGIANWDVVTTLVRKYNIQAFLNGHWHRNYFGYFDGIPGVVGRSNLRARDSVGGYNLVEVRNDSMIYSTRIPGRETKHPWAIVQLGERIYLSDGNMQARINAASTNVRVAWEERFRTSMSAPPAVTDRYRTFALMDGSVHIYKDEKKIATLYTQAPIVASPALDKSRIVVASTDSSISCYEITTQKMIWKVKTGASVVAVPLIDDGVVYCGSSDRKFRAINLKKGTLLWSFDSLQGHVEAKPLIVDEKIIFGAWDEHLYCLDKKSGTLLWKWKGDKPGILLSPAACEPVSAGGKVFIVAPDRYTTAIDIITGKEVWRTNRFQVRETIGMSEDGERVYIRTMNDSLYALSTMSNKPEVIWNLHAGFGYDINSAQIREKDGVLFYATKNGLLIAVDGKSGRLLWKIKVDNVIAHTPIPISKNKVIFSNIIGTVCKVTTD
ncbi:MAG: PQQ-binding-like beta-propeller repeat protein [Bacteroidota bacterium]